MTLLASLLTLLLLVPLAPSTLSTADWWAESDDENKRFGVGAVAGQDADAYASTVLADVGVGGGGSTQGATDDQVFLSENELRLRGLLPYSCASPASDGLHCLPESLPMGGVSVEPPEPDAPSQADIAAFGRELRTEFMSLPLSGTGITHQPPGGKAYVQLDVIVFTDPSAQVHAASPLGVPVQIRATPIAYRWDFGDGTVLETDDPGASWPEATVMHRYSETGTVMISLVTTWRGEFSVAGSEWMSILGSVTTTETAGPLEIVSHRTVLVDRPGQR